MSGYVTYSQLVKRFLWLRTVSGHGKKLKKENFLQGPPPKKDNTILNLTSFGATQTLVF